MVPTRLDVLGLSEETVRTGLRRLMLAVLATRRIEDPAQRERALRKLADEMSSGPLRPTPPIPPGWVQPPEFFTTVLGPYMRFACCLWEEARSLADAEEAMLRLVCRRARLVDGMTVLEVGNGWGDVALWVASHYPHCEVVCIPVSPDREAFIRTRFQRLGLANVAVTPAGVGEVSLGTRFDRILVVETLETVWNYERFFQLLASWLEPGGFVFLDYSCHADTAFVFDARSTDWMTEFFLPRGVFPSANFVRYFSRDLAVANTWVLSGAHYARTARAWLTNLETHQEMLGELLTRTYGRDGPMWLARWRVFLLACEELYSFRQGSDWFVVHHLMEHTS